MNAQSLRLEEAGAGSAPGPIFTLRWWALGSIVTISMLLPLFPDVEPRWTLLKTAALPVAIGVAIGWLTGRWTSSRAVQAGGRRMVALAAVFLALQAAAYVVALPQQRRLEDRPDLAGGLVLMAGIIAGCVAAGIAAGRDPLDAGLFVHITTSSVLYCLPNESHPARYSMSLAWLTVLFGLWVARGGRPRRHPLTAPVAGFLAAATIASVFAEDHDLAWHELTKLLSFAGTFWLAVDRLRLRHSRPWLAASVLAPATLVAWMGLAKMLILAREYGPAIVPQTRLWISALHPNTLGAYAAALIPWLAALAYRRGPMRWWAAGLLPVMALFLLMSYSRMSWLAFLMGTGLWAAISGRRWLMSVHGWRRYAPLALAAAGAVLLLATPNPFAHRIKARLGGEHGASNRIIFWDVVVQAIEQRPLWGFGPLNHYALAGVPAEPDLTRMRWIEAWFHWGDLGCHAHNLLLETAFATGVAGLFSLLWLILAWIRGLAGSRAGRDMDLAPAGAACGATALLLCGLADYPYGYSGIAHLLILLGLFALPDEPSGVELEAAPRGWPVGAGMIAVAGVSVFPSAMAAGHVLLAEYQRLSLRDEVASTTSYGRALAWNPLSRDLRRVLIVRQLTNGDFAAGYATAREGTRRLPSYSPFWRWRGYGEWLFDGDRNAALASFRQAWAHDPYGVFPDEHASDAGLVLAALGRRDEALDWWTQALLLNPDALHQPCWRHALLDDGVETFILAPELMEIAGGKPSLAGAAVLREMMFLQKHPSQPAALRKGPNSTLIRVSRDDLDTVFSVESILPRLERRAEELAVRDPVAGRIALIQAGKVYAVMRRFGDKFRLFSRHSISFMALAREEDLEIKMLDPTQPVVIPKSEQRAPGAEREAQFQFVAPLPQPAGRELSGDQAAGLRARLDQALAAGDASWQDVVRTALESGRNDLAREALERLRLARPGDLLVLQTLANLSTQENRLEEAVALLEELSRLEPAISAIQNNLGNLYLRLDRKANALAAFQRAVAINPYNAKAEYNLGTLKFEQDDLEGAFEAYSRCVALEPEYAFAHYQLAQIYETRDIWKEEAKLTWERFLHITEHDAAMLPYRQEAGQRLEKLHMELIRRPVGKTLE